MRWVDLTVPLSNSIQPYIPGIPYFRSEPLRTRERDGWEAHTLLMTTLSGTYVEASSHILAGGIQLSHLPLDVLIGPAVVIDLATMPSRQVISSDLLERAAPTIRPGDGILVHTGWDRCWNTPGYFIDSPHFAPEAIDWVRGRQARLFGADLPTFDHPTSPQGVIHRLFGHGLVLLAPLMNMAAVAGSRVELVALPLRVEGVCGAPSRVVARRI